jgi:hypothetical protein
MSGAPIIQIGGAAEIDRAWADYQRLMRAEMEDGRLRLDRAHCEARARAWDRFQQLYLAGERSAEIIDFKRGGK